MCHLSMKLSNKFDPNPMYTSDKIVVKHTFAKETLSLTLSLRVKVLANNRIISKGTKIFHLLIKRAGIRLVTVVQLMSQTGYEGPTYENRKKTTKGKQRSRMIRLIITTTGRFLESRTKFNFQFLSISDLGH